MVITFLGTEDTERYAYTAYSDSCGYERGDGYQCDGYSEIIGSVDFKVSVLMFLTVFKQRLNGF